MSLPFDTIFLKPKIEITIKYTKGKKLNLKLIHILYRILGNGGSLRKQEIGSFRERGNGRSVVSVKLTEIADCL